MKTGFLALLLIFAGSFALAADTPTEINLLDGSKLKGKITSNNGSEITVMSDLGVFRIPLEKLTPESKLAVSEATKPEVDALLRKVAELEAKVSQLQQENQALRRQMAASPSPGYSPSGANALTPSPPTPRAAPGGSYTISSTGKRHNSGCRYFGSGRPCGATDGIACKICGG